VKNKYIDRYLKFQCSDQLQGLFSQSANPWKEITESMGAWANIKDLIDPQDKNHAYICVGDGSLCLTGALFAFLTKSQCVSIDPIVNDIKMMTWLQRERVERLKWYRKRYQDTAGVIPDGCKSYDLILVHAHVNLEDLIKHFPNFRYLYSNVCCNPQEQTFSIQSLNDNNISVVKAGYDKANASPENMIFLYKNNNFVTPEIDADAYEDEVDKYESIPF